MSKLTVKEVYRIELSYLLEKEYVKKNTVISGLLSWTDGSSIQFYSDLTTERHYIRLMYRLHSPDQVIDYKVYLTYVKSNLGRGLVPYFICHASGRRCRILYRAFGSSIWKARQSYSERLYYESQLWSKNQRVYGQWYIAEKRLSELSSGMRKQTTYNGNLTRRRKAELNWERKSFNTGLIF
jgi:hypothetical protein